MSNIFVINSEIKRETIRDVAFFINKQEENSEVIFYICSSGGDLFAGISIYNLLKHSKLKIKMINTAIAASAALLIFLAGTERYCYDFSYFLSHDWVNSSVLPMRNIQCEADSCKWQREKGFNIFRQSLSIKEERLLEFFNSERIYIYQSEALDIKLVDAII